MATLVHTSPFSTIPCSICCEELSRTCGRTVVTLRCSHMFHLDCIGSAFNASGVMQCPNCRQIENGVWRRFERESSEREEEDEGFNEADDDILPHYETVPDSDHLCPHHARRVREILSLSANHSMSVPLGTVAGNPHADHYRTDHHMIDEIASIYNHPLTSDLMGVRFAGANQSPAPMLPALNMWVDPAWIPNFESISRQLIDAGLGTRSIGSLFSSGSFGNNMMQMVYNNIYWMQLNNIAAWNAMNGFQQSLPQQSQRIHIAPSMRVPNQDPSPPAMPFPSEYGEGGDNLPPHPMEERE